MRASLLFYRVLAYVVGVGLIILVLVGVPLKYLADSPGVVGVVGPMHGFLYMVYLVATVNLVERNQVATIVPRVAVHRQLASGALRAYSIVSPRLVRRVVSVSHPRRPLNPATKLFISMLAANMRLRAPEVRPPE